jgi:hypothetical protein
MILEGKKEPTKGTPAKFQKMTMKPHLEIRVVSTKDGVASDILFVVHIPGLRDTLLRLSAASEGEWLRVAWDEAKCAPGIQVQPSC